MNDKPELIDRGYAKIFIDRTGEAIIQGRDWLEDNIAEFYYDNPGHIQWNMYLISLVDEIANHVHTTATARGIDEALKDYENNEKFVRCYTSTSFGVDELIAKKFPVYEHETNSATFTLFIGETWHDAEDIAYAHPRPMYLTKSYLRNYGNMTVLGKLDDLRAAVINMAQGKDNGYCTHIEWEKNIIERKFSFLRDRFQTKTK